MEGTIGILTIDNPPGNRLPDPEFVEYDRLREWTGNETLKGIIVTGRGKHFSAGADIDRLRDSARDPSGLAASLDRGKRLLDHLETVDVPTVAALRGTCFGGGLEIALACHIRVCGSNTLFAFPEVNLGLLPGLGGSVRLPGRIGLGRAMEVILTGDIVDAERACKIGLADHLAPPGDVLVRSMKLMKKMVDSKPRDVIRSIVRALNNSQRMDPEEAMREESKAFCDLARGLRPEG